MGKDSAEKIKEHLRSLDALVANLKTTRKEGARRVLVSDNARLFNEVTNEIYGWIKGGKDTSELLQLASEALEKLGLVRSLVGKMEAVDRPYSKLEVWISEIRAKNSKYYGTALGFSKNLFPFSEDLVVGGADSVGVQFHGVELFDWVQAKALLAQKGARFKEEGGVYSFRGKDFSGGYCGTVWTDGSDIPGLFVRFNRQGVGIFAELSWLFGCNIKGYSLYFYLDKKAVFKRMSVGIFSDFWGGFGSRPKEIWLDLWLDGALDERKARDFEKGLGYSVSDKMFTYRDNGVRVLIPPDTAHARFVISYLDGLLSYFQGMDAHARSRKDPVVDAALRLFFRL